MDAAKTLTIRADASPQVGTGHLMRCLALGQAWEDSGGKSVFITNCQSEGLLKRLAEENFDIHLLDRSYPHAGDWDKTRRILGALPDSWVVLDGYHFDETYQKQVKSAGHRLLVIDDMAHLKHYNADIVLNQNLMAEQLHYSCEPYTRLLLGTRYALLRREFLAWRDWQREIPERAQRLLVTLGGSDSNNNTLKVIQALRDIDLPDLEATVVIGASNPHADALEAAIKQSRLPIRSIHDARNMPELMAWADAAISSAGTTVWELVFMGLPALVIVAAENQRCIAESLDSAGVALNLGWYAAVTDEDVKAALTKLLEAKEGRAKISRQGRQLVDGKGEQRVRATMVNSCRGGSPG